MAVLREIRLRARQIVLPVIGACSIGYFAYHAVQGERGLIAWLRLKQDLAQVRVTEAQLAEEREALARRVGLLRPEHLDPDLLDERAHTLLNYGRRDELIILLPESEGPPAGAR